MKLKGLIKEYSYKNKKNNIIPVYSVTNTEGFCTEYFNKEVASADKTGYKLVPRGYFAYNPSRINVGSIDIQNKEDIVIVSPLYVVFFVDETFIYPKYLLYLLKSHVGLQLIRTAATGSVRDNLKFSMLEEFDIPLPPINKQKEIVQKLDFINQTIQQTHQRIELYNELVKSRFIELFGDPVTNEKNWERLTLGDLCEIGSSKRVFEKDYVPTGVPFFRTKEIVELSKGNSISTELFISEEHFAELKKTYGVPRKDDLLISAVGTIGTIWIVSGDFEFYFKDGNLLQIKASSNFNSIFMKYLLDELIANYKKEMSTGTAYSALTIAGLKKMLVYDVPLALQKQFATFVEQTDKSKLAATETLKYLEELKASLMDKYFG